MESPIGVRGRFGHARTPNTTFPSSSNASAIAYWSPLRNLNAYQAMSDWKQEPIKSTEPEIAKYLLYLLFLRCIIGTRKQTKLQISLANSGVLPFHFRILQEQ